ncbi:MAG: 30S ribosomal protein S20 [Oligoflexia bacterium]|nr:30S ribosomal protein S20 [Oligoflexia bacterium]
MATHKSAIKRARQSVKRAERNQNIKSALKTFEKKVRSAVGKKDPKLALDALKEVASAFDRAAAKGVVHAKKAARKVSRLSALVNSLKA